MAMLFIDYTNRVLNDFEEKKSANLLSPLLVNPTTAQIKKECLHVYADRLKKGGRSEDYTLMAFFGVPPDRKNFNYVIERTSPDKFRPLQSLIKGRIKNPASENVELLAWLIDFSLRPYSSAKEISLNEEDSTGKESKLPKLKDTSHLNKKDVEGERSHKVAEPPLPNVTVTNKNDNNKLKWAAAIILILITLFGGFYFSTKQERSYGNVYTGECMTWMYDHYEKVPCSTRRERNRIIVPFDNEMMQTFKRITKEDTISASSIGYVHYIRINGSREYYTRSGYHPIEVNRPLKVLSKLIFDKYLGNKDISLKDVSTQ